MGKFPLILMILLMLPLVSATTIHGTIYNMQLEPAINSIIKVNTSPEQKIVSKDGTYSFELPLGTYTLKAANEDGKTIYSTSQDIKVIGEGDYVVDLILFPDLSEEQDLLNTEIENTDVPYNEEQHSYLLLIIIAILAIALVTLFIVWMNKKTKKKTAKTENNAADADLGEDVLSKIKENGGRINQKELRKEFPFSEAKISLVLTELQHKGQIEKIKKGKGNVIILKNKP